MAAPQPTSRHLARRMRAVQRLLAQRQAQERAGYTPTYDRQRGVTALLGELDTRLDDAIQADGDGDSVRLGRRLEQVGALVLAILELDAAPARQAS